MKKNTAPPELLVRLEAAAAKIAAHLPQPPTVGVVLGSGLGSVTAKLGGATILPYADIPHWPQATVQGHAGELHIGKLGGASCVVLSGRVHGYEGHSQATVAFGVQVLRTLGIRRLVVTNAAGGIAPHFAVGDLMVIGDHLNLTGDHPLRGRNPAALGPRFFDMGEAYCREGRRLWHRAAQQVGISLREGVYAGLLGPSYETPAEVRMLGRLGADAVGMSTVGEVLAARHAGMQVAGLSVITNLAAGLSPAPLSHAEVTATGARVRPLLGSLLECFVAAFGDVPVA